MQGIKTGAETRRCEQCLMSEFLCDLFIASPMN